MTIPSCSDCPSEEELSAYLDNCSGNRQTIESHISGCAKCAARLKALRAVDDEVAKYMALPELSDSSIAKRIRKRVADRITQEEKDSRRAAPWIHTVSVFSRAAGFLIIASLLGFYFHREYFAPKEEHSAPRETASAAVRHDVLPSAGTRASLSSVPAAPSGKIDSANLQNVSFGPASAGSPAGAESAAEIPDSVRQIWSIPEKDSGKAAILLDSRACQAAGIPLDEYRYEKEGTRMTVSFTATKLQTVVFVRFLSRAGFSLLSRVQPQPEQNSFTGAASDRISYSAEFLAE